MAVMFPDQGFTQGCPINGIDTWDDFKQEPRQKKSNSKVSKTTESLNLYQRLHMKTSFSRFRPVRMPCFVSLLS